GKNHRAAAVLGQQLRQVLLENGHTAFTQLLHFGFIVVHADHAMADLGKTRSRHKSHVTRPDYTDRNWLAHALMFSPLAVFRRSIAILYCACWSGAAADFTRPIFSEHRAIR